MRNDPCSFERLIEWLKRENEAKNDRANEIVRWTFLLALLTRACRFQRATKESEISGGEKILLSLDDYATRDESRPMLRNPTGENDRSRVDDDQDEASSSFRASIND